jgi:hypothetical protein
LGEYNMNTIKFALLGTVAFAAVSVSAQASTTSDIAALKAEIAALSAKVAANEAQTSVPAGFQLVTVSSQPAIVVPGIGSEGRDVTTIAIVPTADAPASTVIQWSGFARAALVYADGADGSTKVKTGPLDSSYISTPSNKVEFNVKARGQINVVGKTDTAVGEVGAQMSVRGDWNNNFGNSQGNFNGGDARATVSNAWGWWKMTPDLTLAGGYNGSVSSIGYGYDGACSCYYTDNASQGTALNGDVAQMRLTYSSGPMSVAIAVEDGRGDAFVTNTSVLAFAAKINYTGDMFNAALSGGFEPSYPAFGGNGGGPESKFVANVGVGFGLGDVGKISANAGYGSGHAINDDVWKASILGSLNLSDQAHLELAYGHVSFVTPGTSEDSVLAGVYYEPVSQLTIGLEGEWIKNSAAAQSSFSADLVTVFRF